VGSECDHLPEAGNNNYLGSECDHLPEAGNTYIGIHPFANPSAHPQKQLFKFNTPGGRRRKWKIYRAMPTFY
jgi:hypothetical protein